MVGLSLLCSSESQVLNARESGRQELLDMKCYKRALIGTAIDRIRNREIKGKFCNRKVLVEYVNQSILRWL